MAADAHALTDAERSAYAERGFFVRESVLGATELGALCGAAEALHRRMGEAAARAAGAEHAIDGRRYQWLERSLVKWEWREALAAQIRSMEPVHHLCPELGALARDPRLCAPAAELLGERAVALFTDKLNFKRPLGSPFPWHQDAPYWAFSCAHLERLASVQLYLDDASEANGCLWVIPASHRAGHLPAPEDRGTLGRLYTDVSRLQATRGAAAPAPLALAAPGGSAIFFHPYLVHGSPGNRSPHSRRALVLTYQPPGLPLWDQGGTRPPAAR